MKTLYEKLIEARNNHVDEYDVHTVELMLKKIYDLSKVQKIDIKGNDVYITGDMSVSDLK